MAHAASVLHADALSAWLVSAAARLSVSWWRPRCASALPQLEWLPVEGALPLQLRR